MTQAVSQFSELFTTAAERANAALVHVAGHCRRGASGSVFNDEGLILTTARAVAGKVELEVSQADESVSATVLGFDAATDIGVLRPSTPLGKAPIWQDDPVKLGTLLLGASRPGRALRVRLGLVSQLGEAWHTMRGGRVERYVETDLTPEPGFSGGLAFDAAGRALGMSSAGLLRGVPLLLEKSTLERIVSALSDHGRVRRGYLGVGTQAVRLPDSLRAEAGQSAGLLVSSVQPGSAAEAARIILGDVLLALGAWPLGNAAALQAALEDAEGRAQALIILRAGQKLTLEVTPGARP